MRVALIYPPSANPTAPYISLPLLTAVLRQAGHGVLPIDANVESLAFLWSQDFYQECVETLKQRLEDRLRYKPITHWDRLEFLHLMETTQCAFPSWDMLQKALSIQQHQESFKHLHKRDKNNRTRFWNADSYAWSISVLERALEGIAQAFFPLELKLGTYRTPFALTSVEEIYADSLPTRNPFYAYYEKILLPKLLSFQPECLGISVVFPAQIQQAFALALFFKEHFPLVPCIVGGPALTQLILRIPQQDREKILEFFTSVVLFEGEKAFLELLENLQKALPLEKYVQGTWVENLDALPCPDLSLLPLDLYLAPKLVIPYAPSRGCYWGCCTFCQYGLSGCGTAPYREASVKKIVDDLEYLFETYQTHLFYFSHDSLHPDLAVRLSQEIMRRKLPLRWSSDMRAEPNLTPEVCQTLKSGGALSLALGIESASPRVLKLMGKGLKIENIKTAAQNLSQSGIAVEAMCFTDFPTETFAEAWQTLEFIESFEPHIALFIVGTFALVHGARITLNPHAFGIEEFWALTGDLCQSVLFYREKIPSKTEAQRKKIDKKIDELSQKWWLHHYPWAGSIATAHSMLWFDAYGTSIFKDLWRKPRYRDFPILSRSEPLGKLWTKLYGLYQRLESSTRAAESYAWEQMLNARTLSRALYEHHVATWYKKFSKGI